MIVTGKPLRFCKASLYVHLIIMQSSNGQLLPQPNYPKPKRHNAKLCPFAIRQRIINALANGDSQRAIARALHVSNNTVAAIREQEWQQVAARKERIAAQCELNATLAAERMTDKLQGTDDIPLKTLVPALGVSVDKLAVLRGHAPSVNIANIWMPSEAEREERRAIHARLDAIARRLMEPEPEQPHGARIAP
jgi:transcriptional regulator with XRE-family HTH domain